MLKLITTHSRPRFYEVRDESFVISKGGRWVQVLFHLIHENCDNLNLPPPPHPHTCLVTKCVRRSRQLFTHIDLPYYLCLNYSQTDLNETVQNTHTQENIFYIYLPDYVTPIFTPEFVCVAKDARCVLK